MGKLRLPEQCPCLRFHWARFVLVIGCVAQVVGCGTESPDAGAPAPRRESVIVTSWPLLHLTEALADDGVDVELLPSRKISPDWKPGSSAVRMMQDASRILVSGAGFEPWMRRVTLPQSRLVNTSAGYEDQIIHVPDAVIHQHGPGGHHSHAGDVWATWLDPELVIAQAQAVQQAIEELQPDDADNVRMRAGPLVAELLAVDERLTAIARSTAGDDILVVGDGPYYQYLVRRLGWKLQYVHLPATGPLSEKQQTELSDAIAEYNPRLVFVRSSLWADLVGIRDQSSAVFVEIDLCLRPDGDDSLAFRIHRNLEQIEDALKEKSGKD